MEQHELEMVKRYVNSNADLKALWEEHLRFEKELSRFEGKSFLSPAEELEIKQLKKLKLAGKTKIQLILERVKSKEA